MSTAAPEFSQLPKDLPVYTALRPNSAHLVSLAFAMDGDQPFVFLDNDTNLAGQVTKRSALVFAPSDDLIEKVRLISHQVAGKWLLWVTPVVP
jgi:hypothetical protein